MAVASITSDPLNFGQREAMDLTNNGKEVMFQEPFIEKFLLSQCVVWFSPMPHK